MMKGYYRMITEIDDEIGAIRRLLKEKGLAENTIIIVMGDNGYFTGDRQLADKWLMYDASIRIPLVVYDPRIGKPSTIDDMVLNIDVPKTILSMAGVSIPKAYQGISLAPLLQKGNAPKPRKAILVEHLWKIPDIPSSEGIRTDRWKYFRYRLINAPEELYDLSKDPLETRNLTQYPEYAKILSRLRLQCDRMISHYQSKKLCPDQPYVDEIKF
jgi:arylsulfatase A-like enzyme